jgi:chemotaxis protein methyltransferase CheR
MQDHILHDDEFALLRDLIYRLAGISLSDSKRLLVQSRLQKRLRHYHLDSYRKYYEMVVAQGPNSPEREVLVNCVTTNKTDFFREPHHFEFITETALPDLERRAKGGTGPLWVWHAGCSTGEEPYTLAMVLAEAPEAEGLEVRQFATDIDTVVLAHAQRGVYDEDRIRTVPERLLRRYFLRGVGANAGTYRIRRELREQVAFQQLNLLDERWPMAAGVGFDMIFCRNVVIYFDKPTRQRLFARFAERLRPGGYLFIGHSESLIGISDAYESLGKTIYRLPEYPGGKVLKAA